MWVKENNFVRRPHTIFYYCRTGPSAHLWPSWPLYIPLILSISLNGPSSPHSYAWRVPVGEVVSHIPFLIIFILVILYFPPSSTVQWTNQWRSNTSYLVQVEITNLTSRSYWKWCFILCKFDPPSKSSKSQYYMDILSFFVLHCFTWLHLNARDL